MAAAVVAYCVKPGQRGEVRTFLLAGTLCRTDSERTPEITLSVNDDFSLTLTRWGLTALTGGGAVSLAVTVNGRDVVIEERIVGDSDGQPVDTALFTLDFLAPDRYNFRYNSEPTGSFAAFSLTIRRDMTFSKALTR